MSLSKDKTLYLAGAVVAVSALTYYFMRKSGSKASPEEASKEEATDAALKGDEVAKFFTDVAAGEKRPVFKEEVFQRAKDISNVNYQLAFALLRGGQHFHGKAKVTFSLTKEAADSDRVFIDYRGEKVLGLEINGTKVTSGEPFHDHRIYFPKEHLKEGENVAVIRFISNYVKDCQGVHYFKDKDDGEEYIYSQYEAVDAHKAFPCFDQPNLKAKYTLLVLVPEGWIVRSTMTEDGPTPHKEAKFSEQAKKFGLDEKEFVDLFGGENVSSFEFGLSPLLSVYLYSMVAGPYAVVESDKEEIKKFKYPLKLYCRKSLAKYLGKNKEKYFHVTKCGIEYYEPQFSTPYPFGKLDQFFIPDYNMGAMENVGCITYREQYMEREETFDHIFWQNIFNTFLHELSHMWFGNLVTMNWWDDLWLNESFATFIAYLALDEAPGLEMYQDSWSIFLTRQFWGLREDQKNTTHPISLDVIHSEAAQDIFDGISYGKGSAWLNQTFFMFGKEVFKVGLASYFKEFAFKNTKLEDFLAHMGKAAQSVGIKEDLPKWADTWLKTPGCNIIWHDIAEENGKITKFTVQQRINAEGEGNRLRVQKYKTAFLNEKMEVTKVVEITTKDNEESFDLKELEGEPAPFAQIINYGAKGYGKFKIDPKSVKAFQSNLIDVKDSFSRKLIYIILLDMLKDESISGLQLLEICKKQLVKETAEDVLKFVLQWVIPIVIKTTIPLEYYKESHHNVFELLLTILASGTIKDAQTASTVLDNAMTSVRSEQDYKLLVQWFKSGEVSGADGKKIEGLKLNLKQKHSVVKRIWASEEIPLAEKEAILGELEKVDTSDWMASTKKVCRAAHPGNKDEMWNLFFSDDKTSELKDWGLHDYQHSFLGFNQVNHYEYIKKYEVEFIDKLIEIEGSKGRFVAEAYFYYLRQMNRTDDEFIGKWKDLLQKVTEKDKDNLFFINFLKETIFDLQNKRKLVEASRRFLEANKE